MNMQAHDLYLKTQISTASPGDLTLMLYNGCIKFMKQGMDAIQKQNIADKNTFLQKAQRIVDELIVTLDMKYDISKNLRALYVFVKDKLAEAGMNMDPQCVQDGLEIMTEIRDTWIEVLKQVKVKSKIGM